MRVAVCDDCEEDLQETMFVAKKVFEDMGIKYSFNKFAQADEMIKSQAVFDLVFLDIEMENFEHNGVWAAKRLKMQNPEIKIVFTTNYEEYLDDVIEKYAFRYWKKPMVESRLRKSMAEISEKYTKVRFETYPERNVVTVPICEIIYFTTHEKYSKIVTAHGEYTVQQPFKALKEQICAESFCDSHGSFCVNLNYVVRFTKQEVVMKYGENTYMVHMSRRYYDNFKEKMYEAGDKKI